MKDLMYYINKNSKVLTYVCKLAFKPEDADLKKMKEILDLKYGLKSMSPIKKSIIQKNSVDFPKIPNIEVYSFDVEFEYPTANDETLKEELRQIFKVEPDYIRIRSVDSPIEQEIRAKEKEGDKKDDKAVLLSKPEEVKLSEPLFGDEYTDEMIKTMSSKENQEKLAVYKEYKEKDENDK